MCIQIGIKCNIIFFKKSQFCHWFKHKSLHGHCALFGTAQGILGETASLRSLAGISVLGLIKRLPGVCFSYVLSVEWAELVIWREKHQYPMTSGIEGDGNSGRNSTSYCTQSHYSLSSQESLSRAEQPGLLGGPGELRLPKDCNRTVTLEGSTCCFSCKPGTTIPVDQHLKSLSLPTQDSYPGRVLARWLGARRWTARWGPAVGVSLLHFRAVICSLVSVLLLWTLSGSSYKGKHWELGYSSRSLVHYQHGREHGGRHAKHGAGVSWSTGRERASLGLLWAFESSESTPSDTFPPAKPPFWSFQRVQLLGG